MTTNEAYPQVACPSDLSGGGANPPSSRPPRGSGSFRPLGLQARSFCVLTADPGALTDAVRAATSAVDRPTAVVAFATGALGEQAQATLRALARAFGPIPITLAVGAGALTERGGHEGSSALTGIVWRGGSATALWVNTQASPDKVGAALSEQVVSALGDAVGTVFLFAQPQGFSPQVLHELNRLGAHATVIGGGTLPGGAWCVSPGGDPKQGGAVGLVLRGLARPQVRTSAACKLLGPLVPITEARGAMVLRLDNRPALEVLSARAKDLPGRPLVLAVLAHADGQSTGPRGQVLVRGIRGVDPSRQAIVISEEATAGMLMGFGVCDSGAARTDLQATARELERHMAGAAPQFGLVMTCAGRGASLYGEPDVETRIVRERFAEVPFAGMFSTFEIGPFGASSAMHLYTGVIAMFGAPS